MYDLDWDRTEMAKNVEKPPWNTLDPIWLMALDALYRRFDFFVRSLGGGSTTRYV